MNSNKPQGHLLHHLRGRKLTIKASKSLNVTLVNCACDIHVLADAKQYELKVGAILT